MEHVNAGLIGTVGIDEDPDLNTGDRFRVAARLVNRAGEVGPVVMSDPFEITEGNYQWGPFSCTTAASADGWMLFVLLGLGTVRRRQALSYHKGRRPSSITQL